MEEIFKQFKKTKDTWKVSNTGKITKNDIIHIPRIDVWGYPNLGGGVTVHKLVAKYFLPNPENKPEINHRNGIKSDNRVSNLEWVTKSENMKHAFQIGLCNFKGLKNGNSKLTQEKIGLIKDLRNSGLTYAKIAEIVGVSTMTVCNLIKGNTYK